MITKAGNSHQITATEFAAQSERRRNQFLIGAIVLTLAIGGTYISFWSDGPAVLAMLILTIVSATVVLWNSPRVIFYAMFGGTCLFELFPVNRPDSLTDRVPFFWNINTIFQTYSHSNFKAVPLSFFEVLLIVAGLCSIIRAVYTRSVSLQWGALRKPIYVYLCFVIMGWLNGIATGGDFKVSLQEVRSQFYFAIAYFMAVNFIREQKQVNILWWVMALCVGLKGILYTYRRSVTLAGLPLPDQGVGSHEEAFFFICFLLLLLILMLVGDPAQRRLRGVMWLLTPAVILGDLATNRRAGTAALAIAIPLLMLSVYRSFPHRRRLLTVVAILSAILAPAYYFAFRNSDSAFAQPARAIKSNFQPDERDANSNAYRDAENADQMATIRTAPIQGYGYGKRMLHAVPIADISSDYDWWDLLPHNNVLWIWMRTGTFGFLSFWMMISTGVVFACQTARDETASSDVRTLGLFCIVGIVALLLFGLLDLQLSNFRTMLMIGGWLGVLGGGWWVKEKESKGEGAP